MFLLAGESTLLYEHFLEFDNGILHFLGTQFSHKELHGIVFWDLTQPFFMFIVGVRIPFAVANRLKKGDSKRSITRHALKRSFLLLLFGWGLYCIYAEKIVWQFQNVLAQLAVTFLVAFLIRNKSFSFQIIFTLIILLAYDLAYRFFPVEGFNNPWVKLEDLGAWVNIKIEGVDRGEEWATLNVISTTAHTVWGVLCGKLLMSEKNICYQEQQYVQNRWDELYFHLYVFHAGRRRNFYQEPDSIHHRIVLMDQPHCSGYNNQSACMGSP